MPAGQQQGVIDFANIWCEQVHIAIVHTVILLWVQADTNLALT